MDYKKMFKKLVKKHGTTHGFLCPSSIGLITVEDCEPYPQNCPDCWAKALGLEGEKQ
jgi:hypothetical protein